MIARMWQGWASPDATDDYQRHYESDVAGHPSVIAGFLGARLLRRVDGDSVMFTPITFFSGLDAVRLFAGVDYEQASLKKRHDGRCSDGTPSLPPRGDRRPALSARSGGTSVQAFRSSGIGRRCLKPQPERHQNQPCRRSPGVNPH